MDIRYTGTKNECNIVINYYKQLESDPRIKSMQISHLYPNRGSNMLFRIYVKVEYFDNVLKIEDQKGAKQ